jgi:predicted nucleic acid-binding protein
MKRLKIYLDTCIINFLFAEDAPQLRDVTIDFFENFVQTGKYEVYISEVVVAEIEATKDLEKRSKLLDVLRNYPIQFVTEGMSPEIERLADLYLQQGVIPIKSQVDAFHLAIAVVNQMDILLTWNYKHLANVNRKHRIMQVNLANNYLHPLDLVTPLEVINDAI